MNINLQRISKKNSKVARNRAIKIIKNAQIKLRKNGYKFTFKLVGSGAWSLIIKDQQGKYDLDYQIMLTKNTKAELLKNPTKIREDFQSAFQKELKDDEKIETKKTAITIINSKHNFSLDLVILKEYPEINEIIKRNNTYTENLFTWNLYKDIESRKMWKYFKDLNHFDKRYIIEQMVIPEKIKNIKNNYLVSSYEIFLSKINEHFLKFKKQNNIK